MSVNGPACAYCGRRYDFANRPVRIENTCPECLPKPRRSYRTIVTEAVFGVRRPKHRPDPLGDAVAATQSQVFDDFAASFDRVADVLRTGPAEADALASRLKAVDNERRDPLQRHLLCRATGLHDQRPDGTCRDCEGVVGDAPVCDPDTSLPLNGGAS